MNKPSLITPQTKMADVIHINHLLLPVINRFGIKLGFGDKSVEKICKETGINISFFLDIINTYNDSNYLPKEKMRKYPVKLIIEYLMKTHNYYRDKILPEIEDMITKLIQSCPHNCDNLQLIDEFYKKYRDELLQHLKNEEGKFFPYILEVSEANNVGSEADKIKKKYLFSYDNHREEHENVLGKLFDLKNILIKYLPPTYNQDLGNNLLSALFVFEQDLNDHERLEDIILLPAINDF
ncbi:MAG: hemerythrin domain-containing protein [Bacteroidales bacterium]